MIPPSQTEVVNYCHYSFLNQQSDLSVFTVQCELY